MLSIIGVSAVTVTGSTTALPVVTMLAEFSPVDVQVSGGGSGVGVQNAQKGISDIGMVSRDLKPEETGLKVIPFAYDGVVIITSKDIGVSELSTQQIKDIYNGNITNWNEVGGIDSPIYVLSRETGSGTLDTFLTDIMGDKKADPRGIASICGSNGEMVTSVRGSDCAIGYVGFSYANPNEVGIVKLDGVMPTQDTIKSNEYRLSRLLSFVVQDKKQTGDVQTFIDYVLSTEGQGVVRDNGFIPI